jgi:hypothetical protein
MIGLAPDRRRALIALASAGLVPLLAPFAATAAGRPETLDAFLDVLLPADDLSPAASVLGIGEDLRAMTAPGTPYAQLTDLALNWLDGLDSVPFAGLAPATQVQVVQFMAAADYNEIPGRFYHLTRALAVELYYARPEAITGFPLNSAPQPAGYPPPWS